MAAGPKLIAEEFLRDARKAIHALGYAPGCDLFNDPTDWNYLSERYVDLIGRLEGMVQTLPEGTAEAIREKNHGRT